MGVWAKYNSYNPCTEEVWDSGPINHLSITKAHHMDAKAGVFWRCPVSKQKASLHSKWHSDIWNSTFRRRNRVINKRRRHAGLLEGIPPLIHLAVNAELSAVLFLLAVDTLHLRYPLLSEWHRERPASPYWLYLAFLRYYPTANKNIDKEMSLKRAWDGVLRAVALRTPSQAQCRPPWCDSKGRGDFQWSNVQRHEMMSCIN